MWYHLRKGDELGEGIPVLLQQSARLVVFIIIRYYYDYMMKTPTFFQQYNSSCGVVKIHNQVQNTIKCKEYLHTNI